MKKKKFVCYAAVLIILLPAIIPEQGVTKMFTVVAQDTGQCQDKILQADEHYQAGRWNEAITLLEDCLKQKNIDEAAKGKIYRLLGLVYIAIQLEKEANEAVKNLLIMVPNYKVDPDNDPPTLKKIIDDMSETMNPKITSLSPGSVEAESEGFTLIVRGSNFVYGTVVKFNQAFKATTYINAEELRAEINAGDITVGAEYDVSVYSPIAGGKNSNTQKFIVEAASGFPWTWVAAAGGVAAAVAAIIVLGNKDEDGTQPKPTIADPPVRP